MSVGDSSFGSLAGRTVLVTGSTSGIGRAIACRMGRNGARLIIHGRQSSERSQEVLAELASLGVEAQFVAGDFAVESERCSFLVRAWEAFGGVDVLCNNAGGDVLTGDWGERSFAEKLDYLLDVDVKTTLELSREFGRRANSGVIINVGWDQAWQGMEGDSGEMFSTTKGAIMSMTKSLAQSLAPTSASIVLHRVGSRRIGPIRLQKNGKLGRGSRRYWIDGALRTTSPTWRLSWLPRNLDSSPARFWPSTVVSSSGMREMVDVKIDDLSDGNVIALLKEHRQEMLQFCPCDSVHALDENTMRDKTLTFFRAECDGQFAGCGAIRDLGNGHGEVKSMRTRSEFLRRGIARSVLQAIIQFATEHQFTRLSLETGPQEIFIPAVKLYEKSGFEHCGPFGNYALDSNSIFMTLNLQPQS